MLSTDAVMSLDQPLHRVFAGVAIWSSRIQGDSDGSLRRPVLIREDHMEVADGKP